MPDFLLPRMANPYQTPDTFNYGKPVPLEEPEWEAAPLWTRAVAFLIDASVYGVLVVGFGVAVSIGSERAGRTLSDGELARIAMLLGLLGHLLINWAGWATRGQSLGKRLLNLHIVRKDWGRCSIYRILLRTLPILLLLSAFPLVGLLVGFVDAVLLFRTDAYCLHDDWADTDVVRPVR